MSERLTDEQLREIIADRYGNGTDAEISMARELLVLRAKVAAYRQLDAAQTAQISHYAKNVRVDDAARRTLDSEREANALLTVENERLRKEVAELRAARMSDDIAELGMLVREYGAADDADLTEAAKALKRRVLDACEPLLLRAARAPEGLHVAISNILNDHGMRPQEIGTCRDRILALFQAADPVMPKVPSEAALRVIWYEGYRNLRAALITEQKERGA